MKRRATTSGKSGFSLVELLVALTAGSILALTMSMMLWQSTRGYVRCQDAVDLQRDLRASLDTVTRLARAATNMTFSTSLVFRADVSGRPSASVYPSGGSLYYDPNLSASGDQIVLAQSSLETFHVTLGADGIIVAVGLRSADEVASNRVVIASRN